MCTVVCNTISITICSGLCVPLPSVLTFKSSRSRDHCNDQSRNGAQAYFAYCNPCCPPPACNTPEPKRKRPMMPPQASTQPFSTLYSWRAANRNRQTRLHSTPSAAPPCRSGTPPGRHRARRHRPGRAQYPLRRQRTETNSATLREATASCPHPARFDFREAATATPGRQRVVITGQHCSSVVIRGHQRLSAVISGYQRLSAAIHGYPW